MNHLKSSVTFQKVQTLVFPALHVTKVCRPGFVQGLVPELVITFSHSMIFVGSVEEVQDESKVPVKLSPQPKGRWRWLGTKTLAFQPEHRFPMSTTYQVKVRLLIVPIGNLMKADSERYRRSEWKCFGQIR